MPHLERTCQEVANAPKGGIGENRSCCLKLVRGLGCSCYQDSVGRRGRQEGRARDAIICRLH